MANVKTIIAAHLSQRQRQINRQVERESLLGQDRLLCNIIRVDGDINVPSRPGFIWCQEYSPSDDTSPFHAFNDKSQAREGLTVWIGEGLGGRREVLDWNNGTIVNTPDYAAQKYLPAHHSDHEWPDFKPGPDVVNVYPRSLSMLRTYPGEGGALTVSASSLRYIKSNALVVFPGKISMDISASQPASGLARFVGIYLDPNDNTLKSVDGATTSDSPAITPDSPSFPENAILSANVRLDGDQTTFSEVDMVDVRQILDASGAIDGTRVSKLVSPDGLTDPVFSVDNTGDATLAGAGKLGIGTATIPHGGIGGAIFALDGADSSALSGPHIQATTASDDYPLIQYLHFAHDNIQIQFDAYFDGSQKSSDAGSNFRILKTGDLLRFGYNAGTAQGNTFSWSDGFVLDSAGQVGIGTTSPGGILEVFSSATVKLQFFNGTTYATSVNDGTGVDLMAARRNADTNFWLRVFGGGGGGASDFRILQREGTFTTDSAAVEHFRIVGTSGFVGINGVSSPSTELDIGSGSMEFEEMTAPGAGAANTTRLYAEDSGGTTRQQVVFNGGNTVTIAQDGGLQTYSVTNVVTDRTYDADATSVAELADVLGTLIADFQAAGILA